MKPSKWMGVLTFCLFSMSSFLLAEDPSSLHHPCKPASCHKCVKCHLGTSSFITSNPNDWYQIQAPSYPNTVALSLNGNAGAAQGKVTVNVTGLTINEPGNYWVSFSAVVLNPLDGSILIPLFLVPNGVFNPSDPSTLGSTAYITPGNVQTIQQSGLLQNVVPGTSYSLVATNGNSGSPETVTILGWTISLTKIPCTPTHSVHH